MSELEVVGLICTKHLRPCYDRPSSPHEMAELVRLTDATAAIEKAREKVIAAVRNATEPHRFHGDGDCPWIEELDAALAALKERAIEPKA